MLASVLGVRLVLWLGATVPTPPSVDLLGRLLRVRVRQSADEGDGFELTFSASVDASGEVDLLAGGELDPLTRVWVGLVPGAVPEVLIDGVITHHQLVRGNEPGAATLTVQGTDLTTMLDLEERSLAFPNQPDFVIVNRVLAGYPQFGLVPLVTPTSDVPIEIQRIPRQAGTDLGLVKRLAERNGFVFYLEPVTFGVNNAYWGPDTRAGLPQPALTTNMGPETNVTELTFANDALAPVGAPITVVEPFAKLRLPLPALPPLRFPPLAASAAPILRTRPVRSGANLDPARAALASTAAATSAPEALSGQGELDTVRYGSVLRPRRPVGVRGAGRSYDGNWQVRSVTHMVTRERCTQSFTLRREGTGALLPVVLP